jgi:hypothetical protein
VRDEVLAIARATPLDWLAAGLALLVAGYLAAHLGDIGNEFELGLGLSSPTVTTSLLLALAAGFCWSLGGRGPRTVALIASLLAVMGLLRLPPELWIADRAERAASELVIAALLLLGVVWWCHRRRGALPASELVPRLGRLGRRIAAVVPLRSAVLVLASLTALILAAGAPVVLADAPVPELLLGNERTVDSWLAGALLAAAAMLALLLAGMPGASRWLLLLAGVLGFMAIDEPHGFHDRLEYRASSPALVVLAPMVVLAALAWLGTLRVLPTGRVSDLFVAGGVLWLAAGALDAISGLPTAKTLVEEAFEFSGTSCLLLALLLTVQADQPFAARAGPGSSPPSRA